MTNLFKMVVEYSGLEGLPGTNTLFGDEGDIAVSEMRSQINTFYSAWASSYMTNQVTITIPNSGDIIDSGDGSLIGVWTDGSPITVVGGSSGVWLPPATQALVQFKTSLVVAGRKLRGHIFLPGCLSLVMTNGKPNASLVSAMSAAAQTCFADGFCVFSPTHNTWSSITSATVWNEFAVLRSRRD